MDFTRPARSLHDQVRGLQPWPCAVTELSGATVKVYRTAVGGAVKAAPGTIVRADKTGIEIACGDGLTLRILGASAAKRQADGGGQLSGRPPGAGDGMNDVRKPDARETALEVLMQVDSANAWSDGGLKRTIAKNKLDSRDAALATRLCYGVIQNRMLLDYYIGCWCSQRPERLESVIRQSPSSGATRSCFWIRCRPVPPSTRPWR